MPVEDCIRYLAEFPEMTGQEMLVYHIGKEGRLLSNPVYEPVPDSFQTKQHSYSYITFAGDCYAFINNLGEDVETDLTKNHCVYYLTQDDELTDQEMLDFHEKYKRDLLEKPVNME